MDIVTSNGFSLPNHFHNDMQVRPGTCKEIKWTFKFAIVHLELCISNCTVSRATVKKRAGHDFFIRLFTYSKFIRTYFKFFTAVE